MTSQEVIIGKKDVVANVGRRCLLKIISAISLCFVLSILFIGYRLLGTIRTGLADCLPLYADKACDNLAVSSEERNDLVDEVTIFSEQVALRRVSFFQAFDILWEFDRGPLFEGMLLHGFKSRYLDSESIAGSEQLRRQKQIFDFFSQAWVSGNIASETMAEFMSRVTELRDIDYSSVHNFADIKKAVCLKESLTDSSLERLSALMLGVVSSTTSKPENDPIDLKNIFRSIIAAKFGK